MVEKYINEEQIDVTNPKAPNAEVHESSINIEKSEGKLNLNTMSPEYDPQLTNDEMIEKKQKATGHMKISKISGSNKYKVVTGKGNVSSFGSTKENAEKQANLIRAVSHGWKPTGKK